MPTDPDYVLTHRNRITEFGHVFNALVVRSVGRKEMKATPKAMQAMDDEWNKLLKQKVWDMSSVREYDDIVKEAKDQQKGSLR